MKVYIHQGRQKKHAKVLGLDNIPNISGWRVCHVHGCS